MIDILIVDDEPPMSLMLTRHFERRGYTCASATTVDDAKGMLALQPQACVLDLSIVGGAGESFIGPLKEALPDCLCLVWTAVPEGPRLNRVRTLDINAIVVKAHINSIDQIFEMLPAPREKSGEFRITSGDAQSMAVVSNTARIDHLERLAVAQDAANVARDASDLARDAASLARNTVATELNTKAIVEASNKIEGNQG